MPCGRQWCLLTVAENVPGLSEGPYGGFAHAICACVVSAVPFVGNKWTYLR
jgi:hypothetical protein